MENPRLDRQKLNLRNKVLPKSWTWRNLQLSHHLKDNLLEISNSHQCGLASILISREAIALTSIRAHAPLRHYLCCTMRQQTSWAICAGQLSTSTYFSISSCIYNRHLCTKLIWFLDGLVLDSNLDALTLCYALSKTLNSATIKNAKVLTLNSLISFLEHHSSNSGIQHLKGSRRVRLLILTWTLKAQHLRR